MIEEGNIGLMRALEKYNPRRHTRFSTYATYWIDENVRRAIEDQSHTIKIPAHIQTKLKIWRRQYQKLSQNLGRLPSAREVAAALKLDALELSQIIADLNIALPNKSLETLVSEDANISLEDVIGDAGIPFLQSQNIQRIRQDVTQAVAELPKADRKLLTWRYGLGDTSTHSLAEIGKKMKISRERVRQLLERALRRLKKIVIVTPGVATRGEQEAEKWYKKRSVRMPI
jgi:RNA polymerase sigma factor (sigma-70 family)